MIPYNEREVLKLLQEESTQRKGFELIVAQYSEQLYWQIRRMVLSHEDANDLLQNTFIKAWTNIDYFRAEAKLSTWLYRIALNECLTFLNRQRATTTVAIDDPEAAIVQKLESDPYYSGDQVQMLLQKALLTLPEKQRMVFNLKYYQEMLAYLAPPIVAAFIVGIFSRRVNGQGVFFGLMSGFVIAVLLLFFKTSIFGDMHFLFIVPILFVFSILVMYLVSLCSAAPLPDKLNQNIFTLDFYRKETVELSKIKWYSNYRIWGVILLVLSGILLLILS